MSKRLVRTERQPRSENISQASRHNFKHCPTECVLDHDHWNILDIVCIEPLVLTRSCNFYLPQDLVGLFFCRLSYLSPAKRRLWTSDKALLPLRKATNPTIPAAGNI